MVSIVVHLETRRLFSFTMVIVRVSMRAKASIVAGINAAPSEPPLAAGGRDFCRHVALRININRLRGLLRRVAGDRHPREETCSSHPVARPLHPPCRRNENAQSPSWF